MSLSIDRILTGRPVPRSYAVTIPEYEAVVFEYKFDEGNAANNVSMNNIFFDNRTPATFGAELVTNSEFTGTYVGGVAPDWSVDAGVTASESTGELGQQVQRVTDMNGVSQGLQGTALTLTTGSIYVIDVDVKKISGTGSLQIQLDGMVGMTGTYDVAGASIPTANPIHIKFYAVANSNTSSVTITADDTSLELDVYSVQAKEVGGGNHMVMDFDVYDEANRYINYYDFNGVDQYAYITDARQAGLDMGTSQTSYATIFQMDTAGPGHIFGKWKNGDFSYLFTFESPRFFRQYVSANGITVQNFRGSTVFTVPMTSFSFFGTSYDTPNGIGKMNINGVAESLIYSVGPPLTIINHKNNSFHTAISASFDGSNNPTNFVNGKLGYVLCWKGVALDQAQLTQVYSLLRSSYGI